MRWGNVLAALLVSGALLQPGAAAGQADATRSHFEGVIQGLNDNSFERFNRTIDRKALTARIYSNRIIEPEVKKSFSSDFNGSIQQMYVSSFPKSKKDIIGKVIAYERQADSARAIVRFETSGYRYSFHVYDLAIDSRGRPAIVDWMDYYQGGRFSDEAGAALVMAMPSKPATRNMLKNKNLGEGELFQIGELFKAVRDNKGERFFQIYDGLDEVLTNEPVIARLNMQLALAARDPERAAAAVDTMLNAYPDDGTHSLKLIEYYIPTRQYDKAIATLTRLQNQLGVEEGAIESLKASAAMAMGDLDVAEKYALAAVAAEPSLEVAWWSLLRVRVRAEDYEGATEALTRLEDEFGHRLDANKLRKDRFLKVLAEQQAFQDWRASRD